MAQPFRANVMYSNNRPPWGWPHGPFMGEPEGFMSRRGPMQGQDMTKPGRVPGFGNPQPEMMGNAQPGIMPMGWRLDQLRQRAQDWPTMEWSDGGFGRLGPLWQIRQ